MMPIDNNMKDLIDDISSFSEKNDQEKNELLAKIFENLSQGKFEREFVGDQIVKLFQEFQNTALENELQRDNFSLLIDIASEATRKCNENKRLFSNNENLIQAILNRLPDFEDVSQQQVPGVELLFRICPSVEEKKDAFLSKFKIDNRLIDRFKKINSKNFMRESRVFLVMLNKPLDRLYPQIVGTKRIAVSLGEGVLKDLSTEPFPLDLNRKGFFIPPKDDRAELDLPFQKMMRWRIKDHNGDRILEIQMKKEWALQNSGYLSVVLTLKEDTYSCIAKLLEQNGVEFMSHKASFAQQPVTSNLESSSVGKISDRHKTETWKPIGKVSSAEEVMDIAEKESLIEKKKAKPKIIVSDSKLEELSTSSPLFQDLDTKMHVITLMDMPLIPTEVSVNGSAETEAISAPTAGQKVRVEELEPETTILVAETAVAKIEKKISKPFTPTKPWMKKKVEQSLDEDESFAKDLLAELIPGTKIEDEKKTLRKKSKKSVQKKEDVSEDTETSKRSKRGTRRSVPVDEELKNKAQEKQKSDSKKEMSAGISKKSRSSIVTSIKSSSISDLAAEGLEVRSVKKKPKILPQPKRSIESLLRSDEGDKELRKRKLSREEVLEIESSEKRATKKYVLSPSRGKKMDTEDTRQRMASIASESRISKKASALQHLLGRAKSVTPQPPQETPLAKDRIKPLYSVADFSPLKIHMPSPISQAEALSSPFHDQSDSLGPLIKKISQVYEGYCNNTIKMVHERLKAELAPTEIESQVRSTIKRRVNLALQYESFLDQVSNRLEKLEQQYL